MAAEFVNARRPACVPLHPPWRRLALVVGGVALAAVVVPQVVHVVVWRTGWQPGVDALRRYHRALRPRELRKAGRRGQSAGVVHHTGRKSGKEYVTPVWAHRVGESFYVGLPYGTGVDWLRNVRAAGGCVIEHDGERHHTVDPVVVPLAVVPPALARKRRLFALMGIEHLVRVDIEPPDRTDGPPREEP
jgi:deazaflavin-dependent oxidoreductase (nitroreductase family)